MTQCVSCLQDEEDSNLSVIQNSTYAFTYVDHGIKERKQNKKKRNSVKCEIATLNDQN